MTGMSFAGKTTLARAIHTATGIPLIEPDAIAAEKGWDIANGDLAPEQWQAMMEEAMARTETLLRAGQNVLFDTTATSRAKRDIFRQLATRCGATLCPIAVSISRDEAFQRWQRNNITHERFTVSPEDFDFCAREWSPPTEDENPLYYQAGEATAPWIAHHFASFLATPSH